MDPIMNDYQRAGPSRARRLLLVTAALLLLTAGKAAAASWQGSFNATYQSMQPGETVTVPTVVTSLPGEVVQYRSSVANLANGCTRADTSKCIHIIVASPLTVTGSLEVRGSSVWIDGGASRNINARGWVDIEADSNANHPDHVLLDGWHATSTGMFNVDTAAFRYFDVGPSTAYWNGSKPVCCREGPGFENKVGWGGDTTYTPRNLTWEDGRIHQQNGDSTRLQTGADVHFGGLFIVTVQGFTIRRVVFEKNVVYNIQIQNFDGGPPTGLLIEDSAFGCPVEWLYSGDVCGAGQPSIQLNTESSGVTANIRGNVTSNGVGGTASRNGTFGCNTSCSQAGVSQSNNTNLPNSTTAPPLPGGGNPPPPQCSNGVDDDGDGKIDFPADPGCTSATDNDETNAAPPPACQPPAGTTLVPLAKTAETSSTITLGWAAITGALGYRFGTAPQGTTPTKFSHTWDGSRVSVKFSKVPAGQCYWVEPLKSGGQGGYPALTRPSGV